VTVVKSRLPLSAIPGLIFHGISFDLRDRSTRPFALDGFDAELEDENVFSWVDIQAPDITPMNEVLRRMEIDLTLVSHFDRPEVLPRIVERPDCLAFYLYPIYEPERHLDTTQGISEIEFARLIVVLGVDYVITYHRRPLDAIEETKAGCEESFRLAGKTPGFIAFLLLQHCLYDYAHLNLANDNYLDGLERKLSAGAEGAVHEDIGVASRNVLTLKKLAASLHIVLMLLATKRNRFVSDEGRAFFQEMLRNALAIREGVDSSRDLLDGILGTIQAEAAKRTNEIARVLTIVSSIMLPLTLIAGVYGMNFENMPELKWPVGYYGVLGLMGVTAASLVLVFRRLGWIGKPPGSPPPRKDGPARWRS
jgi:magnesium/cobalt transport protein CorA